MADIYDSISTADQLRNLFIHSGSFEKPTQELKIENEFQLIGGDVGDTNVGTYVIQNLIPGTTYSLRFKIEREIDGIWTNVAGSSNELFRPASVIGAVDSMTVDNFWWSSVDPLNRDILFKTIQDDGTFLESSGFTQTRNNQSPFQPQGTKINSLSTNATYFTLSPDGRPAYGPNNSDVRDFGGPNSLLGVNTCAYDAFLFFFAYPNIPPSVGEELDEYLTAGFRDRKDYIGYDQTNETKGFLKIPNVHSATPDTPININLGDSQFIPTGAFGVPMDRNKQYYAAFMFVNKTAKYIVSGRNSSQIMYIKWSVFNVPFGGVWSISLRNFRQVHDVDGQLSKSTSVAVEIDGIGVQGTISSTDQFRITMTATPV